MKRTKDIAIIGPGKVGTALGVLAAKAGWQVVAVAGRSVEKAQAAAKAIGPEVAAVSPSQAAAAGELVLLTVPDDAIEGLCRQLAESGALRAGSIVAHCSGALGSEILAMARDRCDCAIGSMHPLQTFPTVEVAVAKLPGAHFFCEGTETAVEVFRQFAADIGAKAVQIAPAVPAVEQLASAITGKAAPTAGAGKCLYHAAAVMACNYLAALMDAALTLAKEAGIDRQVALEALEPLVRATVDNIFATGPAEALTGPISRGDIATVRRHLEAIYGCGEKLSAFYRAAGVWTSMLAEKKAAIDSATAEALRKLLTKQQQQ